MFDFYNDINRFLWVSEKDFDCALIIIDNFAYLLPCKKGAKASSLKIVQAFRLL